METALCFIAVLSPISITILKESGYYCFPNKKKD